MIKLEIDEKDVHVLRITASYFLALAGDIDVTITPNPSVLDPIKYDKPSEEIKPHTGPDTVVSTAQFTEAVKIPDGATLSIHTGTPPDGPEVMGILPADEFVNPVEVFAPGKDAPFIAAVEAFATAPVDTTATTLTPTPTPDIAPPVATPDSSAAHVAPHTANLVELDSRGLPWDARIHSRERTKIANGQWKNKRGTDPELIKTVEAELAGVMSSAPASAPVVTPPPVIVAPPPSPATSANVASPSNVTPPPAPSNVPLDFPSIMRKITTAVTGKIMTATQAAELAQRYGVTSPALLINRPDLFPAIDAELDIIIAGGPQV